MEVILRTGTHLRRKLGEQKSCRGMDIASGCCENAAATPDQKSCPFCSSRMSTTLTQHRVSAVPSSEEKDRPRTILRSLVMLERHNRAVKGWCFGDKCLPFASVRCPCIETAKSAHNVLTSCSQGVNGQIVQKRYFLCFVIINFKEQYYSCTVEITVSPVPCSWPLAMWAKDEVHWAQMSLMNTCSLCASFTGKRG